MHMLGGLVRVRQVVHKQTGLEERVLENLNKTMSAVLLDFAL